MLKIKIISSYGNEYEFSEEIENISWRLRNPEGTAYNVSMPTISADIVLHSTSSVLQEIRQGDSLYIINSNGERKLTLEIVSITVLYDKGKAEIVCSGKRLGKLLLGTGVYDLATDYLPYSLSTTRIKLSQNRQLREGSAIIRNAEDAILAYLWGGDRLLNVAPTEFALGDTNFDYVTFEDEGLEVPTYKISPDNIIEFDVTPANPVVTGLAYPSYVKGSPVNSLSVPSSNAMKPFFIDGLDIQAVHTLVGNEHDIQAQFLSWSDGHVNDLGNQELINVLGIFSDSYLTLKPVQEIVSIKTDTNTSWSYAELVDTGMDYLHSWIDISGSQPPNVYRIATVYRKPSVGDNVYGLQWNAELNKWDFQGVVGSITEIEYIDNEDDGVVSLVDKYTNETINTRELKNWKYYFTRLILDPEVPQVMPRATVTTVANEEILWFNTTRHFGNDWFNVGFTKNLNIVSVPKGDFAGSVSASTYYFTSALIESPEKVSAVFAEIVSDTVSWFKLVRQNYVSNMRAANIHYMPFGPVYAMPEDCFDTDARLNNDELAIVFVERSPGWTMSFIITVSMNNPYVNLIGFEGHWEFLDSGDLSVANFNEAPLVQLHTRGDFGALRVYNNIDDRTVIQALEPDKHIAWSGSAGRNIQRYRDRTVTALTVFSDPSTFTYLYDVYLFRSPVPWLAQEVSSENKIVQLNEGVENNMFLPFISAPLERLNISIKERGRITVDVTSFYVNVNGEDIELSAQDLHLPAIMSMMYVDTGAGEVRKMKILGIDIEYGGLVKMRISGILVD